MISKVIKIRRPSHKLRRNTSWFMRVKPGHRFERVARSKIRS